MPRSARRLVALLLPAALAGCGLLEPDHGRVQVRYREAAPLDRDRLVVSVIDGESTWYLEGTDLERDADGWLASRTLRVSARGQLQVLATLRGEGEGVVAAGDVRLPLDETAHWRVDIFPSDAEIGDACGSCSGIQRFVIAADARPSARDWLYVSWTDPSTAGP